MSELFGQIWILAFKREGNMGTLKDNRYRHYTEKKSNADNDTLGGANLVARSGTSIEMNTTQDEVDTAVQLLKSGRKKRMSMAKEGSLQLGAIVREIIIQCTIITRSQVELLPLRLSLPCCRNLGSITQAN